MRRLYFILLFTLAYSTVIHVPGDYTTIQEGIDASFEGDTVLVPKVGTLRIDFEGEEYYLAQDKEVLAVVKEKLTKEEQENIKQSADYGI